MKKDIILVGAGGHCHAVIDVIEQTNLYTIVGVIDNSKKSGDFILGYPILGDDRDIPILIKKCKDFVITVGQIKSSKVRYKLFKKIKSYGGNMPVIVSPLSYLSKRVTLGEGTTIMHNAFINSNVVVGVNNIINTGSILEHDSIIGNHNHISTSAILNGNVVLENDSFIGSGTVVQHGVRICSDVIIGAASLVTSDIKFKGVYFGSPVKRSEK